MQLLARARVMPPIARVLPDLEQLQSGVYLVGGSVRDLILEREFVDVDLATDGDTRKLAVRLGSPQPLGESRFSTLRVINTGVRYDIARTRSEHYAYPGALPEVKPAPIAIDLLRRDFTINAFALGLVGDDAGRLMAAPRAFDDLERRELAVLHQASFADDPTRLLRLARYAARLDFKIAPHTRELAAKAITTGAVDTVSGTRFGNELRLLAVEPDPIAAFEAAADVGLPWTIDAPLARGALTVLPADGRPDIVVLAAVSLGDDLDSLGFTAGDRNAILEARTRGPELAARMADVSSGAEIARAVAGAGVATVAVASAIGPPAAPQRWLRELRHLKLQISGDDLRAAGVAEGPAIGRGLQAARNAMYDGSGLDRDSQLRVALQAAE
jgi:tRNA nucleotidyltransferase (CCA-adding enzyme)